MEQNIHQFWSMSQADLFRGLNTAGDGLASAEALNRIGIYGANRLKPPKRSGTLTLLAGQFKSPIILILLFATGLSFFLHDPADAAII
ncbi:MAG TPA: cation-transporting P-type ATPase, partial [Bacteroidales bacterium]|nr:cation-transporting P-type ATPase [Bacteroidales bacterium]